MPSKAEGNRPNGEQQGGNERKDAPATAIARAILDAIAAIPQTTEQANASPRDRARAIVVAAALRAAAFSGALALPPGPWGVFTILPDLATVWRIQAQMVADISGAFGKTAELKQEQMLYCLFKHAAAQIMRDVAARAGERIIFKQASMRALQTLALKLGVKVSQRTIAKSVAKWLPVAGAVGVAGYAYFDTSQVGATAIELFEHEIIGSLDGEAPDAPRP
jgi:hypothetical protein